MKYKQIPIEDIEPSPFQVREKFDEESLRELASSLESQGDIQPVIVREKGDKSYQLICGERRWRASKKAGLDELPVLIRDTEPENILLESLVENIHREDLTSTERENAVYELWESRNWETKEELAQELGKNGEWVRENINAALKRREEIVPVEATTRDIHDVSGLEQKEREKVLEKKVEGEVDSQDLREFRNLVKNADEGTKEILLHPGVTMEDARKIVKQEEMEEAIEEKSGEEEVPEEEKQEWQEKAEEAEEERNEILAQEETQEKGKLRKNWQDLNSIYARMKETTCPICGEPATEHLKFDCHDLTVEEAKKLAKEEYQKAVNGGDN